MPTEQELRDNPLQGFVVGPGCVWYDADTGLFYALVPGASDNGDTHTFATYQELIASLPRDWA